MSRPKIHDEALRVRLLDAAGVLLAAEGPDALSVRRMATEVGTSTSAVYSLFGGKPGLLRALFAGHELGYHPVDDVEVYAGEILFGSEPDCTGDEMLALVGGDFATREPLT